jgi:hypothetical protein
MDRHQTDADRGYDADSALVNQQGAWANIPLKRTKEINAL